MDIKCFFIKKPDPSSMKYLQEKVKKQNDEIYRLKTIIDQYHFENWQRVKQNHKT